MLYMFLIYEYRYSITMFFKRSFIYLATLSFLLIHTTINNHAFAALDIKITQGHIDPIPVAIPDIVSEDEKGIAIAKTIHDIILADLKNCGLFQLIPASSHIQDSQSLLSHPKYPEWRLIKADNVVSSRILIKNKQVRVEFRIFDTVREVQIEGKAMTGQLDDVRRIAHKVADAIYERLVGDQGYFDTQVVYVSRTQKGIQRQERLAIMDYDGQNHFYLTDGKNLVLSPRFSPNQQFITYMDFAKNQPRVYIYDRGTKRTTLIGNFPGMTFAPSFSNDGKRMVMSFSNRGNTSLFEMNLETLKIKRLTFEPVIDTSPCYSPDDQNIVFESDRSGQTQLYLMDTAGGSAKRISFGSGSYRTPTWSPRGDMIAFTKIWRGEFYIGIMRTDGSGERLITKGYLVEGPAWSPNGRVLMYTRDDRRGSPQLYTIDITGFNEKRVPTPNMALQASWSQKR